MRNTLSLKAHIAKKGRKALLRKKAKDDIHTDLFTIHTHSIQKIG